MGVDMKSLKLHALLFCMLICQSQYFIPLNIVEAKPQHGGILRATLPGALVSLDIHQEENTDVLIPLVPCYNNLVQYSLQEDSQVVPDLAESWKISDDGVIYTFNIHHGVKFHDGGELTSEDIKASFEKIVFPPNNIVSPRKNLFRAIQSIEDPDPYTVVFHLNYPDTFFLSTLAHPTAVIYSKKYIDRDPHYYENHIMGTGPFKMKSWVRGRYLEIEQHAEYFKPDLPYLEGIKFFMIEGAEERVDLVSSGSIDIDFGELPLAKTQDIQHQLGKKIYLNKSGSSYQWGVAINTNKKPLDDERVRKALTLAIDRYDMANKFSRISGESYIGGIVYPESPWALPSDQLEMLPGFGKDHQANIIEAKRLLSESHFSKDSKIILTNLSTNSSYIAYGDYLIKSWSKIGIDVEQKLVNNLRWNESKDTKDFELLFYPYNASVTPNPNEKFIQFLSGSTMNWTGFSKSRFDNLFNTQMAAIDSNKRLVLIQEMQKTVLENTIWIPGLWKAGIEISSSRLSNYLSYQNSWNYRQKFEVLQVAYKFEPRIKIWRVYIDRTSSKMTKCIVEYSLSSLSTLHIEIYSHHDPFKPIIKETYNRIIDGDMRTMEIPWSYSSGLYIINIKASNIDGKAPQSVFDSKDFWVK